MTGKKIHIISFDNPYPPNFGGIIDVFYKIKYLKELGYSIILHVYTSDFQVASQLKELCKEIYVYKKKKALYNYFSLLPFTVKSRYDELILENLNKDDYPILFEGLHTTYPILSANFSSRKIYLRAHNIEHNYYNGLAKSETNYIKKIAFKWEEYKLKRYEKKVLPKFDAVFPISNYETKYFKNKYSTKIELLSIFHQNKVVVELNEKGKYALYQGDLKVSDNKKVVRRLIKMFDNIKYPLVIAGNLALEEFKSQFRITSQNISYQQIKDNKHLLQLFANAHINVLFSYQNTGTKLKLINALYNSRFCLINDYMIDDKEIKKCCIVENDLSKYKEQIIKLADMPYNEILQRKVVLQNFGVKESIIFSNYLKK